MNYIYIMGQKNYICKCSLGHCEGVGTVENHCPEEFPESVLKLSPLLFCGTSLSCGCVKENSRNGARELGEMAYLYDTGRLNAQSEVGSSALLRVC